MDFTRIKDSIKVLIGLADAIPPKKEKIIKDKCCPVCSKENVQFLPIHESHMQEWDKQGFVHSIFQLETLNILEYKCSNCFASDRQRLYALFFEKNVSANQQISFLDIAPSKAFSFFLKKKYPNIIVRTADLFMPDVDDKVDIQDMGIYPDSSFDALICSHVLEHVPDDQKAIKELYRVLKTGGWGIIMVPILLSLNETLESESFNTPELRWKYYGQNDHLRMYSKNGFFEKLKNNGFLVHQVSAQDLCGTEELKFGINPRSILYVVEKIGQ